MKLLDRPFVFVRWGDAHCVGGTNEMAEHEIPHAPAPYTRSGHVLRQDTTGITLASEYSDSNTWRSIDFIPAAMIIEVVPVRFTVIKPKKPKRKAEDVRQDQAQAV